MIEGHHFIIGGCTESIILSGCFAKARKPFTVGEELIPSAAKGICHELLGEVAVQKGAHVPRLASTMAGRIDEAAEDTEAQSLERISEPPWHALQADKPADADNRPAMPVFVRPVFPEDEGREDMSYALLLSTNTTAAELFKSLNDHVPRTMNQSFCVGISMDGAAAVTGRLSGFITRVRVVASEWKSTHCHP